MIAVRINTPSDITNYQKIYSSLVRFSYNRFKDGLNAKEIERLIKDIKTFSTFTVYVQRCAILKAEEVFNRGGKVIFGGKQNFIKRCKGLITKEEYQEKRLMPITVTGEKHQLGNRNFRLDMENNQIIFRINKDVVFPIQLPKLRKRLQKELMELQRLCMNKEACFTGSITDKWISLSFDECAVNNLKIRDLDKERVLGIDLNPNYIGLSILEFKNDEFRVLHKEVIDTKQLNIKTGNQAYWGNKRKHEQSKINQHIISLASKYTCASIACEDLHMESKDHNKGRNYNRLVNNMWERRRQINNLKKWSNIYGFKVIEVNPAFSSFIGNVNYGDSETPDMIAASIEIARRSYKKYEKYWFYPKFENSPTLNRWKEEGLGVFSDWKELYYKIKNSKVKYRISLGNTTPSRVFSLYSNRSLTNVMVYSGG